MDQILQEKDSEVTEIQKLMIQRVDRLELVLKQLAKLLAKDTNYAALISGPQYHRNKLKFIQLSKVDVHKLLIVTVVEGNLIKNSIVNIQEEISDEELLNLNILLNSSLNGLTIEEISLGVISRMKEQAGPHSQVVDLVLNEVADAIKAGRRGPADLHQRRHQHFQVPGAQRQPEGQPAAQHAGTYGEPSGSWWTRSMKMKTKTGFRCTSATSRR